jgi:hypothetical protein
MTPVKTITSKTYYSRPVGSLSDQFPTRGNPSEQSPPRTTSIRLMRQAARSHKQSPPPTKVWATPRGTTSRRKHLHRDAWGTDSLCHATHKLAAGAGSWPRQGP